MVFWSWGMVSRFGCEFVVILIVIKRFVVNCWFVVTRLWNQLKMRWLVFWSFIMGIGGSMVKGLGAWQMWRLFWSKWLWFWGVYWVFYRFWYRIRNLYRHWDFD